MRSARESRAVPLRVRALRMLARRDYSRAELALRLSARGAARSEIDPLLDEFERLGYLSDHRYAAGVVAQRAGRYARRAIAQDLRDKGIPAASAGEALAGLDGRDDLADAVALCARRFTGPPGDERDKARRVRFLMSRGYGIAVALKAVGSIVREGYVEPDPE